MLCLHGEEAAKSTTENGTFWFCNQPEKCHFVCSDEQAYIYDAAIKEFLATNQPIPTCCRGEKTPRRNAKMKVVTDMEKPNFGRPFFVCPKEDDPCKYFEWGDQQIIEKPLCKHEKPSGLFTVKKEGPNKGRMFFRCREKEKENKCKFFKWFYGPDPEDPLLPGCITLFSMPPCYKYTVKKTGAMFSSSEKDRKKAYAEFLQRGAKHDAPDIHQQTHIAFLRAANYLPKPSTGDTDLFGRPFIPAEKREFHPQTSGETDLFTPPDMKKWISTKKALEKRLTCKELDNEQVENKKRRIVLDDN